MGDGRAEGCHLGARPGRGVPSRGTSTHPVPSRLPAPSVRVEAQAGAAPRPEQAAVSIRPRRHAALPAALRRPCPHAANAAVPPAAGGAAGEAGGRCGVLAAPQPRRPPRTAALSSGAPLPLPAAAGASRGKEKGALPRPPPHNFSTRGGRGGVHRHKQGAQDPLPPPLPSLGDKSSRAMHRDGDALPPSPR